MRARHGGETMSEMNFQISRDKFYNALTIASRAISSN